MIGTRLSVLISKILNRFIGGCVEECTMMMYLMRWLINQEFCSSVIRMWDQLNIFDMNAEQYKNQSISARK